MPLESPSAKRRRLSTSPQTTPTPPRKSRKLANGLQRFIPHIDFWLDDGNLVLVAGDTAFRVYRGLLTKNCSVFEDMFEAGSADTSETCQGYPAIRLSDHPEDLRDFLQSLMPCSEPRLRDGQPVSDFSELHAIIHLAHKYQCPDVETRALSVLKRYYTAHFIDYVRYSTSRPSMPAPEGAAAIAAVNIARLTNTVSMLPFALYQVCTLGGLMIDGYQRRDGTVEYLSTQDLRLCVGAQKTLAKEMFLFVKEVFQRKPGPGCKTTYRCTIALVNICDDMELNEIGKFELLDFYHDAITDWAVKFGLCTICKRGMLTRQLEGRRRVWNMLPDVFCMTAEECGFTSTTPPW